MALEVKVPAVGESVQEAMIHKWHKATGDFVEMDEVILELETDKATVEIVAESEGVLETLCAEGDTVGIGDTVAKIDTDAKRPAGSAPVEAAPAPAPAAAPAPAPTPVASSSSNGPAVGRMAAETGIDPSSIAGSGKGGRVTKGDMLAAQSGGGKTAAVTSAAPAAPAAAIAPPPACC